MSKLIYLFVLLICGRSAAQSCQFSYGTKTLYTPLQTVYTPAPEGFVPGFINHVGRHGARHLTKDVASYKAYQLIMQANSRKGLTAEGKKLKQMLQALRDLELPHLKSISTQGAEEQRAIAERMHDRDSALFSGSVSTRITVTSEVRTRQSADAFLAGMKRRIKLMAAEPIVDDSALRFFDQSAAYAAFEENGPWKAEWQRLIESTPYQAAVLSLTKRVFLRSFALSSTERLAFCQDLHGLMSIIPSVQKEAIDSSFFSLSGFFSCAELQQFSKADQMEDYLLKGPGLDSMGIQVRIAAPLLLQFIASTDRFLQHGENKLELRFAHAETIAPFAALLQLRSASTPGKSLPHFQQVWQPENVVPLSANIQWIIYQHPQSDTVLLKVLLNEKEAEIKGLHTNHYPFYDWETVRTFYRKLVSQIQTAAGKDLAYQIVPDLHK